MNDKELDRALRRLAGDPQPTEADRRVSWRALSEVMEAEKARQQSDTKARPPSRRLALVASAAVAFLLLGAITVVITRPTPAAAALNEIATVAEKVATPAASEGRYFYLHSETVDLNEFPADAFTGQRAQPLVYLVPATRELWIGASGTAVLRTTTGTPQFFSPEDEQDYYRAGIDTIDRVGEVVTETFEGVSSILEERQWPTEPRALQEAIKQSLPPEYDRPESVEILDLSLGLLRQPNTPPPLRGATLRVIGGLGLTLNERFPDGGGTFSTAYDQPQSTRIAVTIDGNGNLVHESITLVDGDADRGIPAGTTIAEATYQPARIVRNAPPTE